MNMMFAIRFSHFSINILTIQWLMNIWMTYIKQNELINCLHLSLWVIKLWFLGTVLFTSGCATHQNSTLRDRSFNKVSNCSIYFVYYEVVSVVTLDFWQNDFSRCGYLPFNLYKLTCSTYIRHPTRCCQHGQSDCHLKIPHQSLHSLSLGSTTRRNIIHLKKLVQDLSNPRIDYHQ